MEEIFNKIDEILERKKQIILYGVPGVGKTYLAKKFTKTFSNASLSVFTNILCNVDLEGTLIFLF